MVAAQLSVVTAAAAAAADIRESSLGDSLFSDDEDLLQSANHNHNTPATAAAGVGGDGGRGSSNKVTAGDQPSHRRQSVTSASQKRVSGDSHNSSFSLEGDEESDVEIDYQELASLNIAVGGGGGTATAAAAAPPAAAAGVPSGLRAPLVQAGATHRASMQHQQPPLQRPTTSHGLQVPLSNRSSTPEQQSHFQQQQQPHFQQQQQQQMRRPSTSHAACDPAQGAFVAGLGGGGGGAESASRSPPQAAQAQSAAASSVFYGHVSGSPMSSMSMNSSNNFGTSTPAAVAARAAQPGRNSVRRGPAV